eukprot:m51a1_g4095 hypothetical protein (303) ;mRNA; f:73232-74947
MIARVSQHRHLAPTRQPRLHAPAIAIGVALASLVSSVVAQCAEDGPQTESYDGFPYRSYMIVGANGQQPLCPGGPATQYTVGGWAQLSTPRSVPWRYTRICIALYTPDRGDNVTVVLHAEVAIYAVDVRGTGALAVGPRVSSAGIALRLPVWGSSRVSDYFVSVDLNQSATPLVAWSKGVFVGVTYWSCRQVFIFASESRNETLGRLAFSFDPDARAWQAFASQTGPISKITALAIRTDGEPYAPKSWQCDVLFYSAGDACDCLCGTYDPDCDSISKVTGCHHGQTCSYKGDTCLSVCPLLG